MTYLKPKKADIVFIQESHFRAEEAMKLKFGWVGHVFHSKRNEVVILIHKSLNFTLIRQMKDKDGRICLQAKINGRDIVFCNIYAPMIECPKIFHEVNKIQRGNGGRYNFGRRF